MAVNESRSMTANLEAGLSDGTVKKVAPNWGGDDTDVYSALKRNEVLPSYYDAITWGEKTTVEKVAQRQTKLSEKDPPFDFDAPISVAPEKPLIP